MPVGNGSRSTEAAQEPNRAFGKEQLKQQAQSVADERKETLARGIESVGAAFRRTGEQLRNEDQGNISQYVEMLGDKVSQAARYLREKDPRDLSMDVERFARRQPAIFLGGAFAIGFIAARFLKSSAQRMADTDLEPELEPNVGAGGGYGSGGYGSSGYGGGSYGGMPPQTS
jgi:hypothetical protein